VSVADGLSIQLYSARFFETLERQMAVLAQIGYRRVEPYGALIGAADQLKRLLDEHGMTAPSAHVGLDRLRADARGTARICRGLGVAFIFAPAPPPNERDKDAAGWRALGRELAAIGKAVNGEGLRFGWHNHAFEFKRTADGSLPLDLIFAEAPELLLQADLAWIVRGGADPFAVLERYAGRVPSCHVKDIAPAGQCLDEDGWADVGHGTMDWGRLVPAMHKAGVTLFVAEHDKPSDVARFARRTRDAVAVWR
jgi:sugar phosphate isomerase/epimerase